MKMLRWGYVVSSLTMLAFGLSAWSSCQGAIYTADYAASIDYRWTIVDIQPKDTSAQQGISIAGLVSGTSAGILEAGFAEATYNRLLELQDENGVPFPNDSAGGLFEGDSILMQMGVSGRAGDPAGTGLAESVAASEVAGFAGLQFTNLTGGFIEYTVQFRLDFEHLLSADVFDLPTESAFASTNVTLSDGTSELLNEMYEVNQGESQFPGSAFLEHTFTLDGSDSITFTLNATLNGYATSSYSESGSGGGGGNNDPNAVPEPSTIAIWSLFGVVGLTVGAIRRPRK